MADQLMEARRLVLALEAEFHKAGLPLDRQPTFQALKRVLGLKGRGQPATFTVADFVAATQDIRRTR